MEQARQEAVQGPADGSATASSSPGRRRLARGTRSMLAVCAIALGIHLIPLLLPRDTPEQELAIARVTVGAEPRVRILLPLKDHPKATGAELREAAELLVAGAPAQAQELAREAERREPGKVETQLLIARICDMERMERCARVALDEARQLAPGDARPDVLRAELREKNGDTEGAAQAMGEAFQKAPTDALIGMRLARLASAANQPTVAMEALAALQGRVPRARLLVEQSLVRTTEGRDAEAVLLLRKAIDEDPRLSVAQLELGVALYRQGDLEGATEALRQADRLDLSNPKALLTLCAMQLKDQRLEDARLTRMDLERRFSERMEFVRQTCPMP
ncbi:tetratricopeptide repeat protein [Myxococcus dinghuensis]|uniref:tetratricopeptide repeat protein n=1 Tax=Myxococcus dinghuensis TaxID=2906761 RepID=UPI002115603D|nr:tetratricopeptide repeat protein [Myxococcus dinghuensis]